MHASRLRVPWALRHKIRDGRVIGAVSLVALIAASQAGAFRPDELPDPGQAVSAPRPKPCDVALEAYRRGRAAAMEQGLNADTYFPARPDCEVK